MYVDTTSDCTLANFVKTYLILQQYLTGRAYNLQNFLKKKKEKINNQKDKIISNSETKFNTRAAYHNSTFHTREVERS